MKRKNKESEIVNESYELGFKHGYNNALLDMRKRIKDMNKDGSE